MEEVRPVIKVDIGESQKSVKGLKDEIKILKDYILNLEKGTKEYNDAVVKLQKNQRELDEVMSLTKKTATALDGSYDALTHQMSLLRKEWKATNDEARRNELGAQIDEINSKLKEMDASVGNFQRNVGNYQSALDGVGDSAKKVSKEMVSASAAPKDFGTAMREMNESIEPTKQKFEAVGNIASGLAGGFAAAQGAMALLGVESEGFEKTMIKIQSAMAIAQGVSGLKGLVEGLGRAKVAFAGLGDKIKAVSKVMGKAGWLAVILTVTTAVIGLVEWLKKGGKESEDFAKKQEEIKNVNDRVGESVGNVIAEFNLLKKEYSKLNTLDEKKKWIEENASAFEKLGLRIGDVNAADEVFYKNTDKVIAALRARAKAEALTELYKEKVKETEQKKENIKKEYPAKSYSFSSNPTFKGPEEFKPYYTRVDASKKPQWSGVWKQNTDDASQAAIERIVQRNYDNAIAAVDADLIKWEEKMDSAEELALAAEKAVSDLVTGPGGGSSSSSSSSKPKKEIKIEVAEGVKEEIKLLEDLYKRKIELAESASFDQKKIDEDVYNLTLEREEKVLDAIEYGIEEAQTLRTEAEKKDIDLQNKISKEKNTTKKKELQAQLQETQELIKKYYLVERELLTAKADQEVVIEQVKYDESKRLRQLDLEDEAKAIETAERLYQDSLNKLSSTYGTVEKKKRGWFGKYVGSIFGVDAIDENNQAEAQQENDSNYYSAAYEAEQKFLNDKLALKKAALADERNTDEEKLTYQQEIADIELEIQQSKYAEEDRLRQESLAKEKKKQENVKAIFNASLSATADILGSLADMYESDEENSEENAKKIKGLRIAEATINTINGAVGAFSQAAATIPPPAGLIVGGVQAAAVTAAGIANIMKIKNTKMDGSGSDLGGGGTGAATPSIGSFTNDTPYSYTRQLTGASEVDTLNQDTRVYILESDIQESNKKVQIRESESSF